MSARAPMATWAKAGATALAVAAWWPAAFGAAATAVDPSTMKRVQTVDERFQSYNVEMVEVTGGRFWAPYATGSDAAPAAPGTPVAGLDPRLFRTRAPLDLSNPRLRALAAALGPAYIRVSGTWANSTYFHDAIEAPPAAPPAGFGGILTRQQWRGVVDFARAANARIVMSFAVSDGVRDAAGVWTPDQARKLLAFTRSIGGDVAAAELFNEPSFASFGGAPKGYDAAAYARDFAVFRSFAKREAPGMLILGPGSVGEAGALATGVPVLGTADLLAATGRGVDAFSYHFYGAVSKRCGSFGDASQTTADAALSPEWLARTERDRAFYAGLRDRFEPGTPLWLTETGEAACGGNPWASTFLDTFRYVNQLGLLARQGVQVVAHNTLAASDYALIDEETMTPRPSYWAAVLWRRLMGPAVLDAGASAVEHVYVYAHCLRGRPGGVALLAINADRHAPHDLTLPRPSERYTLSAGDLMGTRVDLNGQELRVGADNSLPRLAGASAPTGALTLAPASLTFVAVPGAANPACR